MTLSLTLLLAMAANQPVPQTLRACGDIGEFPPYTYRIGGEVTGYNVDMLRALLAGSRRSVTFSLLPWKRCLAMSAAGQFDIVLDAAGTPDRRRDYLLVRSHYAISPIYLYSTAQAAPELQSQQDLLRYRRCEILGWDYSGTGIPNADDQVTRPATIDAALSMLRNARCELMVYDRELVLGLQQLHGQAWLDGLGYKVIPWLSPYALHFGVSRRLPYAQALTALLDEGVATLQKKGESTRMLERYLSK